jgi:ABC-type oligopeptide transport system substrate-binding subunit
MNKTIQSRPTRYLLGLVIAVCFAAVGCSGGEQSDDLSRTFNRSINSDPESLDPHAFRSVQAGYVLRDIGEGLVAYGPTGELVAGVATEWNVSEDGLVYVFNLRKDARWSNGEPLTAADFVDSYRRLFDPKTAAPSASYAQMIVSAPSILRGEAEPETLGVTALDAHTLEIRLSNPTPYFLQVLTNASMLPVYKASSKDQTGRSESVISVSNGAYTLAEVVIGSSIRLKRNEHYWNNDNTWFDEVLYRSLDPQSELLGFRAGEIDFTNSVATGGFDMMQRNRPDELKVAPSLTVYYYGFNLTRPPFKDNPTLRQALSMAIDREIIVEKVTKRGELPAYSFVPEGIEGYTPSQFSFSSMTPEERVKEAQRLYAEAGYGPDNPASFELRYNTQGDHQMIALAIQSMWTETLGADIQLLNEEFRVLLTNIQEMRITEAFRLSWNGDYLDPQTFLQLFQTSNPNNLTGYSNPKIDELMARAEKETDANERLALLRQVEALALADHPVIPIYFFVNKHMVASDVVGYNPSLLDIHYSKDFRRVSVEDK